MFPARLIKLIRTMSDIIKELKTQYGKFILRPYTNNDEKEVIKLWQLAFNKKLDKRIWRWKFHNNPFGHQIILCLTENNTPIAMYGGIPYIANWNGQRIRITQLIDNMSHPNYRYATKGRKGLFVQTAEHFFEVYGGPHASVFLYGFPGQKHYRLGKIFLDYAMVKDGGGYYEAAPSQINKKYLFSSERIIKIHTIDKRLDRLWIEAQKDYVFAVCRNHQFLKWRFLNHPINKYEILALQKKNKLTAYAILTIKNETATIVDLFGKKSSLSISKIIFKIAQILKKWKVKKIKIWLPKNHFVTKHLLHTGFTGKKEPYGIITAGKSFHNKLDEQFALKNLYYTMADGDLF